MLREKAPSLRWGFEAAQSFLDAWNGDSEQPGGAYNEDNGSHEEDGSEVTVLVDASVDQEGRMGVAAVIKNPEKKVIAMAIKGQHGLYSPIVAEAIAIKLGFNLARKLGVARILIRSDCLQLINFLNDCKVSKDLDVYASDVLVSFLRDRACFQSAKFRHVPRSLNMGAHVLANMGRSGHDHGEWIGNVPVNLVSICD